MGGCLAPVAGWCKGVLEKLAGRFRHAYGTVMDCEFLIIGAGAAGLFCAGTARAQGASVVVIDHVARPGEKIRISGGGR